MTPASLLMFWDYDTQWGGDRSRGGQGVRHYGHAEFENTEKLLEMHAAFNIPACFAIVGAAALSGPRPYHDPDQVRRIHAAGHEVGSHSLLHEWLPGLSGDALRHTLDASRRALENCIGAPVTTFVPPFNQPFDYPPALSISISERREARPVRTGLADLCDALMQTGYRFCRVAYRSVIWRSVEALAGRRIDRAARLHTIRGIHCAKLNTPCGFGESTQNLIARNLDKGGLWVVYGHPHSASDDGSQSFSNLQAFLGKVSQWKNKGKILCFLPRQLPVSAVSARAIPVWT